MLQKSTRRHWERLKIDRIALKFFILSLQLFKSSNFALMKKIHFLLRNIRKIGLVFYQPRYKTLHVHACIVSYRCWKKTSPIFVIFLNKKWIFFIKAKLLLLKSWNNKKKISERFEQFYAFLNTIWWIFEASGTITAKLTI